MANPEWAGGFDKKELREKTKEGIVDSVKSFGLDLLGATAIVGGIGLAFFGGEVILPAGRVVGYLVLTVNGVQWLTSANGLMDEAISAFKRVQEIKAYAGKHALAKQNLAH